MANEKKKDKDTPKKEKKKKEKADDSGAEDDGDKKKKKEKKKGPPALPPEFALGARVEIIRHVMVSMQRRRGVSMGTFIVDEDKNVLVAVKIEGPLQKNSTVDCGKVEPNKYIRQVGLQADSVL